MKMLATNCEQAFAQQQHSEPATICEHLFALRVTTSQSLPRSSLRGFTKNKRFPRSVFSSNDWAGNEFRDSSQTCSSVTEGDQLHRLCRSFSNHAMLIRILREMVLENLRSPIGTSSTQLHVVATQPQHERIRATFFVG